MPDNFIVIHLIKHKLIKSPPLQSSVHIAIQNSKQPTHFLLNFPWSLPLPLPACVWVRESTCVVPSPEVCVESANARRAAGLRRVRHAAR